MVSETEHKSDYQRQVEKYGAAHVRKVARVNFKKYRDAHLDQRREYEANYQRAYRTSLGSRSMGDLQGTGVTYVDPELALLAWSTDIPSGELADQFNVTSSYVTTLRAGRMGKPVIRSILEAAKNLEAKGYKL